MTFYEIFIETFTDDGILGIIIGILLWACFITIALLLFWGIFELFDSMFLQEKDGFGKVIGKRYIASHTSIIMVYNAATKTSMPQTIHHPDAWNIDVEIEGDECSIEVSESYYVKIVFGKTYPVKYKVSRFSKSLSLQDILMNQ